MRLWTGLAPKHPGDRYLCQLLGGAVLVILAVTFALFLKSLAHRTRKETSVILIGARHAEAISARHEWSLRQLEGQRREIRP